MNHAAQERSENYNRVLYVVYVWIYRRLLEYVPKSSVEIFYVDIFPEDHTQEIHEGGHGPIFVANLLR